jgi:predicted lipid-binding transport protein (Tim44 family)
MGDGSLGAPAGTMDTKPGINSGNELPPPQAQPAAGTPLAGTAPSPSQGSGGGLFSGLLLGIAAYFLFQNREKVLALIGQIPLLNKPKQ